MKHKLSELFGTYLAEHNPDILLELERENRVGAFIEAAIESLEIHPDELACQGLPNYLIEEICLEQLTQGVRPSRYDYLLSLLADEFSTTLTDWTERNLLPQAGVALLGDCGPVFDRFGFSEQKVEDKRLRDEMITVIQRSLRTPDSTSYVDSLLETVLNK